MHFLPLLSTIVSLIFACAVFAQYASRRKPHQLVWGVGLLFYAISTFAEVLAGAERPTDLVYRVWYLVGAIFVAAYLGMGTVYLLVPRRTAHAVMALLAAASLVAAYLIFAAPVSLEALQPGKLSGLGLPNNVRLLTPVFNIFGAGALIIGALYSAWMYWQRRIFPERVVSNVLIAIGAFFPSVGGTMARFGIPELLYVFELFGVVFIFAGFLANYEVIASRFAVKAKAAV